MKVSGIMHRRTAGFLLLVALVGHLGPLALAVTAPPPRACCVRKAVHHCHNSAAPEAASEAGQLVVRDAGGCNHECCRAVTPAPWAYAQPPATTRFADNVEAYPGQSSLGSSNTKVASFQSTRAPPRFSLA